MILRDYQQKVIDDARNAFARRMRAVLLCMPTGAGKTYTASTIVHGSSAKGNVTWWLAHRRELIGQASQTFHALGIPHGVVQAGHISNPHARVQVASVQSIIRRIDELPPPDLMVFDECHHIGSDSWSTLFNRFPRARVLGLTATPWRLDGQGLGNWFQEMVLGPSVASLIENGALSPYRLFAPANPDLSEVGTIGGDFKRGALSQAMDKPQIVGDAIGHYKRLCHGKRAVVFAAGVQNSQNIAAQFRESGVTAEHIDGAMAAHDRDAAVARFRSGQTLVLSNSDILGEGFDVPAIEAAILLRPTKSLSLHLQQVGRALRPCEGKTEAIILDHAGNSLIHGLPDDEREWDLADREKKSRKAPAEVPVRQCEECFFVYRPAPKCPQCGHAVEIKAREIEVVEGTLQEVRKVEAQKQRRMQESECHTLDDWRRLAAERGYKPGWAMHRWQARQRRAA